VLNPLHATIEEFAAHGYTHIEWPISYLPRISMGLTVAQLSARLSCAESGGLVHSIKPWRMERGKPLGRRG
jgi:hypothetical protein